MTRRSIAILLSLALLPAAPSGAQGDESLRNEVHEAINRGIRYLVAQQKEDGSIGNPDYPGITALGAMAILGNPARKAGETPAEAVRACDFLLSRQKEDGGIYHVSLPNYNTSLALSALTMMDGDRYREAALKARRSVISGQYDHDANGEMDSPYDGGVGYGSKPPTDMSNTHFALEALHHARKLLADDPDRAAQEPRLNYEAAIAFVSRCQNLSATNDQSWVSEDPDNRGGFIYRPGESKAGTAELPDGRTALRSYASMGYAGLLSFIYADVKPSDKRVVAVKDWLSRHYSVTENPGMGQEGLFYYYHTMAKALNLSHMDFVPLPDGRRADWRLDLARQLFNLQNPDGSWLNPNGRWMEKDSVLVTAYAVLALEHLAARL